MSLMSSNLLDNYMPSSNLKSGHMRYLLLYLLSSIVIFSVTWGCKENPSDPTGKNKPNLDISNDLNVGFIKRLPEIDYVKNSDNPETEGWPSPGQQVTWEAHVINWDSSAYENVGYRWELDGEVMESGNINMPALKTTTLELQWPWEFNRHTVTLTIDPENQIKEFSESNNELTIYTDALSVGLYVEQKFYDYFHENQHLLEGLGSNSFEDYAQRSFNELNRWFQESTYPEAPDGVLDRVRIDDITLVPDGALPLNKEVLDDRGFDPVQAKPNINDRTVDLQWGFPNKRLDSFDDKTYISRKSDFNHFYIDGFVLHEVLHARYLLDNYGADVYHGTGNSWIDIKENGKLVAGSKFMFGQKTNRNGVEGLLMYETKHNGIMTDVNNTTISLYNVLALNDIAGYRATVGNYNHPENEGVFLNYLPENNNLTLISEIDEVPISNANVEVYQSTIPPEQYLTNDNRSYDKFYDNTPDLSLKTDAEGKVNLGKNPFSNDGPVVMAEVGSSPGDTYYSNATCIIRVETESQAGYTFLEALDFNLEYFKGNVTNASYKRTVHLHNN